MARIRPLDLDEMPPEVEQSIRARQKNLGFVTNSVRVTAHRPEFANALTQLQQAVMTGTVDPRLKRLVYLMTSTVTGCRYCQAHNALASDRMGIDAAKVAALWDFETSDLFSGAERAALRLARDASQIPNASTEDHFVELREHFDDGEMLEIVAAIAMMRFMNTMNGTIAPEVEEQPMAIALANLSGIDWEPERHAPSPQI